jgi:hypothetical protein
MPNISQKIAKKINKEKIAPLPRWRFLLKNDLIWIAAGISAIFGSIIASIIIHVVLNRDWFVYLGPHRLPTPHLLTDLPVIWLIILILTIFIAYYNVEHSKTGYRYSPYLIVLGSLLFSVVFGAFFNFAGFGARLEAGVARELPIYKSVENRADELWKEPGEGHLGGQITTLGDNNLELEDLQNKIWHVDTTNAHCFCGILLKVNQKVKIIGTETGENQFKAEDIYCWLGPNPRRLFRPESMLPRPEINFF